jgi:hypothetical protein
MLEGASGELCHSLMETSAAEKDKGSSRCGFGDIPLMRSLYAHSGSSECLSYMDEWKISCLSRHTTCRRLQEFNMPLPTRLIDVGDAETPPSLRVSSLGETGAWLSLSYCVCINLYYFPRFLLLPLFFS